jgi:hypothetical protein
MKPRFLLTTLSIATMLVALSSLQPAFAFTNKLQASVWCAMIKMQQCHVNPKLDGYQLCSHWGSVSYIGGSVKCCMSWYCGNIH